ncbi:MAG: phosphoribosyl-ATP diphosphatase [Candidatus Micrarchaeota archaeon]|nr:phosphoribosyl-ATP diphosphatase [Candidatus Micrarchaeota archaeon]
MDKLIPLIVQDNETKQVLSLFYCNKKSIALMKKTGYVWRYSRQYKKQMQKGATSGNTQRIISLEYDCDRDAFLATVKQEGENACHTGKWSCFSAKQNTSWGYLEELMAVIKQRRQSKKQNKKSYVASIVNSPKKIGAKLREEAAELAEAIGEKERKEVVWEAADLLFFTLVALENRRVSAEEVIQELKRRRK